MSAAPEVNPDPDPRALPETALSARIDAAIRRVGNAISWIWLVLMGVIVTNVTLRYLLDSGRVELEELQWHLYSAGFLCGLSYAFECDAHIRVDVLRSRLTPRMRAWIELYGILLLLFPFVALVGIYAIPFVAESVLRSEISQSPGGLPFRWLIKSALPIGFALLAAAGLSRLLRICALLFGRAGGRA